MLLGAGLRLRLRIRLGLGLRLEPEDFPGSLSEILEDTNLIRVRFLKGLKISLKFGFEFRGG